jgi:hypothetical protein
MNYPTAEEIRLAHDAINADGPAAETTIRLGAMVLHDPVLRRIVNRMAREVDQSPRRPTEATVLAGIVTGLNYGLRIHEQRIAAERREKAGGAS